VGSNFRFLAQHDEQLVRLGMLALAVLLAACRTEQIDFSRADCMNEGGDAHYYPTGLLGTSRHDYDEDAVIRRWFSSYLLSMKEPTLSCRQAADASYRFLWLRSFNHPIVVRVVYDADIANLNAVELDGAGGHTPGSEIRRVTRRLSAEESSAILAEVRKAAFWDLPSKENMVGIDGAEWIIEGRDGARYHVVRRWSPVAGPVREIGLQLLRIASLTPSDQETDKIY
jgi:hypothetical protein